MSARNRNALRLSAIPLSGTVLLALSTVPAWAQDQGEQQVASNEIIVTAQKREERLKDVPVPVTAVGGDDLLAQNQTKAQELFATIPGVNLQFQNNRAQLSIRGISTGPVSGNPVVGFVIDDVPFGASTGQGGLFGSAPDLDPSELARIEVLRGPQGTLYGAASIGGLVKYVTIDPDPSALSGSVGGGIAKIKESGDLSYNMRGAINVPLGETVAVRASAFLRDEAGYIDNIRTGEADVNETRVKGGRVAMMFEPSDSFSVKLGALYQVRDIYGSSNVDVTTGSYYQQTDNIGSGRSKSKTQMYSAIFNADLGGVDVVSITAFSKANNYDFLDFTASPLPGFLFPVVFPDEDPEDLADIFQQEYNVKKWSHETRFSGTVGMIDWIVGGFYTKEDANYNLDNFATYADTGESLGKLIIWRDKVKYKEYAGFANIDVRLSEQFDIQFGGRYSHNRQKMFHNELFQGSPFPDEPFPGVNNPTASGNAFTYQISPRFKPNDDTMLYARVASGYRAGGTNAICGDVGLVDENDNPILVPCQFKPDKTVNYELGAKGDLAGGALSYDLSLFQIDWKDIQIVQVIDFATYNGNAGKARSRGFELSMQARPTDNLTLDAWYSYVDATLREEFVDANFYAVKGDRLPYSSKHSARFAADYEMAVNANLTTHFGASATYVGQRKGEFVPFEEVAPLRATYPGYVQFDLNASAEFDAFKISAFVQNVTNKHGVIGGGFWNQTTYNPNYFNFAQPRTIGLNAEVNF